VLDASGRIERGYPDVSPDTHADEILKDAKKL
jgi:peroxiredoxin